MLMISKVRGLFPDEPIQVFLVYFREMIGSTVIQEQSMLPAAVQRMMCASAKKLIADITVQHDKLKHSTPYVNIDTNEELKRELKFETHGQLSLLQPWLTKVILPKVDSIIPASRYDTAIGRVMRKKYTQIAAIASYAGEYSAPIALKESLTGV